MAPRSSAQLGTTKRTGCRCLALATWHGHKAHTNYQPITAHREISRGGPRLPLPFAVPGLLPSVPMELGGGGGESAAKRARLSTGVDGLSALPDDLIVLILLKLSSTRAAAQTSVLCRSWRRVWALLPALSFTLTQPADPARLRDALDGHEVPVRSLQVGAPGAAAESLGVWLHAAARRVSGYLGLYSYVEVSEQEEKGEAPPHRGVFELPCFEKATSIKFLLSFHGLGVPRAGVFARLSKLHLYRVWVHGPDDLGDAVSSPRCPCLQSLTLDDARGLADLSIRSDTLLEVELRGLRSLSRLTVEASALRELTVVLCFVKNPPVANISAPLMTNLDWDDEYDPSSVHLGEMPHLRSLGIDSYLVYGNHAFIHNYFWLSLVQRFEGIKTLSLTLVYLPDIENYQYLMEDLTQLPDITFLRLTVATNGHAFEASAFHVLRLCTGIRRLMLQFFLEVRNTLCSSDCICDDQPAEWETEELLLNHLEELEITSWTGSEHEVAFMKRLLNWATRLKEMKVTFHFTISKIKAKELYQVFQSFSRPGVCAKFYIYHKHSGSVLYTGT